MPPAIFWVFLAETENVTVSPVFTWLAESWDENRTSGTCRADTWMVPELAPSARDAPSGSSASLTMSSTG